MCFFHLKMFFKVPIFYCRLEMCTSCSCALLTTFIRSKSLVWSYFSIWSIHSFGFCIYTVLNLKPCYNALYAFVALNAFLRQAISNRTAKLNKLYFLNWYLWKENWFSLLPLHCHIRVLWSLCCFIEVQSHFHV